MSNAALRSPFQLRRAAGAAAAAQDANVRGIAEALKRKAMLRLIIYAAMIMAASITFSDIALVMFFRFLRRTRAGQGQKTASRFYPVTLNNIILQFRLLASRTF